jgi:NCS1 family nucleobase:cation symporter-1
VLVDYYLVRRTQLNILDLYRFDGRYRGVNARALIALVLGVAPNLPGFLNQVGIRETSGLLVELYHFAWFTGLGVAGFVYWLLMPKKLGPDQA